MGVTLPLKITRAVNIVLNRQHGERRAPSLREGGEGNGVALCSGMLAVLLATPCSAPFVGTAVVCLG